MKSAISLGLVVLALVVGAADARADVRTEVLRKAAADFGVPPRPPETAPVDPTEAALGRRLFEERALSLNGDISCRDCHLDEFGSADGLPNAIGVGGVGKGAARAMKGGQIVPRNVLPLWGRGDAGFDVLFWDGKVNARNGAVVSQFGDATPADDPLLVAVHLPVTEFREMLTDDAETAELYEKEDVSAAQALYDRLTARVLATGDYAAGLGALYGVPPEDLRFLHVARAITAFIRDEFRLRDTRFQRFLRGEADLSVQEVAGGLVFFGKGRCATCHGGPYFSDLDFHAVPLPQAGFGKNGFGVDYGRFNVTHDPADLYKFRTPPLINVIRTAPYGHSGALYSLRDAIRAHVDPLALIDPKAMDPLARHELFKRLMAAEAERATVNYLDEDDLAALEAFLGTLALPGE